jgi:hypothetical protein
MTLLRLFRRYSVLTLLGACRLQETSIDANAVIGQWGGVGAGVDARATMTTLRLPCDRLTFPAPIITAEDGRFVVQAMGRSASSIRPSPPAVLRGRMVGDVLTIDVLFIRPDTSWSVARTLTRDAAPDISGVCTA